MFCVSVFIVLVSVVAVSLAGVFESRCASLMSRKLSSDFSSVYSYSAIIRKNSEKYSPRTKKPGVPAPGCGLRNWPNL